MRSTPPADSRSSVPGRFRLHARAWTVGALPLLAAGVLALGGCSSVKTQVDTGPIRARTFAFMNPGLRRAPADADTTATVHRLVQAAITKNLAAKGVQLAPQGADLTVAYLVIVGNNVSTTSLNEYFGYGDEATALREKVHTEQAIQSKNRNYFEAGTLVIDLLDARTSKLLKRASVKSQVLRDLPTESRAARLQTFVDQALADLRIAP